MTSITTTGANPKTKSLWLLSCLLLLSSLAVAAEHLVRHGNRVEKTDAERAVEAGRELGKKGKKHKKSKKGKKSTKSKSGSKSSGKDNCDDEVEKALEEERERVAEEANAAYTCPAFAVAQFGLPCPVEGGGIPEGDPALIGKPGTRVLPPFGREADPLFCPQNGEARPEVLTDYVTPYENLYVRNNGQIPLRAQEMELGDWTLTIDGFVENPQVFTMDMLKNEFTHYTRTHWMACAGQGRAGFRPKLGGLGGPGDGNQWTNGAVGNIVWTGVLLRDVLEKVGLKAEAEFVAWYGEDKSCSEEPGNAIKDEDSVISRGIDIPKALDEFTMLAFAMNGEDIPATHGYPLRLIAPGYLGAAQGKWLRRLWVRDQEHDGKKMTGWTYRMANQRFFPGNVTSKTPPDEYDPPIETFIVDTMPVYSIITTPARCHSTTSTMVPMAGKTWSGIGDVDKVELSYDDGLTWVETTLNPPVNKWAWQEWMHTLELPGRGQYQIMARATDMEGRVQPLVAPNWNPKGYLNNAIMAVDVDVMV